jgi:hypothetical protein
VCPRLRFDRFSQGVEPTRPKLVEVRSRRSESVIADREQVSHTLPGLSHQTGAAKDSQMVRCRLLRQPHVLRNLADRPGFVTHGGKNGATVAVCQCPQDAIERLIKSFGSGIHALIISTNVHLYT